MLGTSSLLYKFDGNTDAALITHLSYRAKAPNTGLCILFELKKPEKIETSSVYQAACELVLALANFLSPQLQPVVLLTDLCDHWQLFWLDGLDVNMGLWSSRANAVTSLKVLVKDAERRAMQAAGMVAEAGAATVTNESSLLPALATRRPFTRQHVVHGDVAETGLADLAGMLPEEELMEGASLPLLQQVRQLPAFSGLHS